MGTPKKKPMETQTTRRPKDEVDLMNRVFEEPKKAHHAMLSWGIPHSIIEYSADGTLQLTVEDERTINVLRESHDVVRGTTQLRLSRMAIHRIIALLGLDANYLRQTPENSEQTSSG